MIPFSYGLLKVWENILGEPSILLSEYFREYFKKFLYEVYCLNVFIFVIVPQMFLSQLFLVNHTLLKLYTHLWISSII